MFSGCRVLMLQVGYIEHGVIVHGAGLDEISPLGPSKVIEIRNTAAAGQPKQYDTKEYVIDPKEYGFPGCTMEDLRGGGRDENARLLREALQGGTWTNNGKKDAITLNAGIGLYVYGLAPTIEDAFKLAKSTLESGAASTQVWRICCRCHLRMSKCSEFFRYRLPFCFQNDS